MREVLTSTSFYKQVLLFATICVVLWIGDLIIPNLLNPYIFMIVVYCGINIIFGVSLNVINGICGQLSLGHAGFMAVGAYASSAVSFYIFAPWAEQLGPVAQQGLFFLTVIIGGSFAGLVGYVVGLPTLRLRGDYLAIVTIGFGEIIRVVILNLDFIGGARGFAGIPAWSNFFWVFFFVVALIMTSFRMMKSYHGRALLSVREDEIAAESIGVNIAAYKVKAFIFGAFFAGVAGALFAHYISYLNPSTFQFVQSFEALIIVILGGMGSITGSIVAAIVTTILPEALRPLQEFTRVDFRMVIYPLLLLTLMLTRPQGLFGHKEFYDVIPFFKKRHRP
jgi:branched-chain amino acid transport system permease protein